MWYHISSMCAWYDGAPVPEEDKLYFESVRRIKNAAGSMGFEQACALIELKDEKLRSEIIEDALKVIIAEEHFQKQVPLSELARRLRLPAERLENARKQMLLDVEDEAVRKWKKDSDAL